MPKQNQTLLHVAFVVAILLASAGCGGSVAPAKHYDDRDLSSLKTAFVVQQPAADQAVGMGLQNALSERGLRVSTGTIEQKPADVDFYVVYVDHWQWDMAMYLCGLDVQFLDGKTGQVIASGSYGQGVLHDYPDLNGVAREVVNSIFKSK